MTSIAAAEGIAAIISAVGATAGTVETIHARNMQARLAANQARSQINQLKIAQQQKSSQRTQTLINSIGDSSVQEIARNVSLASPSFQAAQSQSYREYASDKEDSMLNTMYRTNTLEQQINQMDMSRDVGNAQSIYNLGQYFGNSLDLYAQEQQNNPAPTPPTSKPKPKGNNSDDNNAWERGMV